MKRKWLKFVLTGVFVAGLVGSSYAEGIKFDGELRLRGVSVNNSDGTDAGKLTDGGFFEQRTRLNAGATIDENTTVFIQAQDSRMWGSEANTTTSGNGALGLDLSQGYVKMGKLLDQPLSLTIGRQALAYGEHRLIGSLEWSNNARRFDALKLTYNHEIADVDVFWAKVSESGADFATDENLLGVYGNIKNIPVVNSVDVYLIDKICNGCSTAKDVAGTDIKGKTKFYTIGGRIKSDLKSVGVDNVDYNAEIAIQSGDAGTVTVGTTETKIDQSASAFALRAGYTLPDVMGLRVGVEYDSATGANGTEAAFDNLYPTNHYLYGYNDDINWSNVTATSLNVSAKPMDKMKVAVEYWMYTRAEKIATTAATTAAGTAGKDDLGTEINIKVNHEKSKNVNCELAYVIRDNGDAAAINAYSQGQYGRIPTDKSSTFAYFMVNVKFN